MKTEDEHRRDICTAGRWISRPRFRRRHRRQYFRPPGFARAFSPRPPAISKGMMTPDDLVITDHARPAHRRPPRASSELAMHLLIYRRRPDVNAVCHAHPPTATGYAAAGIPLNKAMSAKWCCRSGCIPVAQYGTPGTPELTEALEPLVQQLRRDPDGQSRRGHLRAGSADRVFPHGDRRTFCTEFRW